MLALALVALAILNPHPPAHSIGSVTVLDTTLARVIHETRTASPAFRAIFDELAVGDVPVYIGNADQARGATPAPFRFEAGLAYARALPVLPDVVRMHRNPNTVVRVERIVVLIDVHVLQLAYQAYDGSDMAGDLPVILAHELAHALGWSRSRRMDIGCFDPTIPEMQGNPFADGCAVEHENRVRAELGRPKRNGYFADGLSFTGPRIALELPYAPAITRPMSVHLLGTPE